MDTFTITTTTRYPDGVTTRITTTATTASVSFDRRSIGGSSKRSSRRSRGSRGSRRRRGHAVDNEESAAYLADPCILGLLAMDEDETDNRALLRGAPFSRGRGGGLGATQGGKQRVQLKTLFVGGGNPYGNSAVASADRKNKKLQKKANCTLTTASPSAPHLRDGGVFAAPTFDGKAVLLSEWSASRVVVAEPDIRLCSPGLGLGALTSGRVGSLMDTTAAEFCSSSSLESDSVASRGSRRRQRNRNPTKTENVVNIRRSRSSAPKKQPRRCEKRWLSPLPSPGVIPLLDPLPSSAENCVNSEGGLCHMLLSLP